MINRVADFFINRVENFAEFGHKKGKSFVKRAAHRRTPPFFCEYPPPPLSRAHITTQDIPVKRRIMAPVPTTLPCIHQEKNLKSDCKFQLKFLAGNATTRNIVDLLLVIVILVLLGVAAPVLRGDRCGKFSLLTMRCLQIITALQRRCMNCTQ